MSREVICADSIEWLSKLEDDSLPIGYCGFTSLPDISEMPHIFGNYSNLKLNEYKKWFTDTVYLFMSKLPDKSYVIFLQSDVRCTVNGEVVQWIDKSHLCSNAADKTNCCTLMWHKLVTINKSPNKRSTGRPTYSHLVCYYKNRNCSSLNKEVVNLNNLNIVDNFATKINRSKRNYF
jgi:hypothetical protein